MKCAKCASELPPAGGYCVVCGARRGDIDRLVADARTAAGKAIGASVAALDRAAKEVEPAIQRIVAVLQPTVNELGKALQPLADTTVRAVSDVANIFRPVARESMKAATVVANRTVSAVRPVVAKAAEKTHAAARRVREATRKLG